MRNRIVAVVALIVAIVLLFNLVTCVAGLLNPSSSQDEATSNTGSTGIVSTAGGVSATVARSAATILSTVGVEDPWVPSGRFTTGDAELDAIVKNFCDSNTNGELTQAENAFNVYCYAIWTEYLERDNNQYPTGPTWDIAYAKQMMAEGSCNCYEQVAIGEFILKYFGYTDAQAEPCLVLLQSGGYGDHGLLFVTDKDGRKCLCDPAFGSDGWMLDADSYTYKLVDVGQDPSEYNVANFEEVVKASWL